MSVRFDAAADRLLRTANLPSYDSNYSASFWLNFSTRPGNGVYFVVFIINDNTNDADYVVLVGNSASDTRLVIGTQSGGTFVETTGATNLSPSTWYHIGLIRSANNSRIAYIGTLTTPLAQEVNHAQNVSGRTAPTRMEFGAWRSANSDPYNGLIFNPKIWTSARTMAELQNQQFIVQPDFYDNLHLWSPTLPGSGNRNVDYSGNGYNWTEGGTLTDEDDPAIAWGGPVWTFQPVTVSSQTISPGGIATGEVFGSTGVAQEGIISPTGLASGEAFGTATVGAAAVSVSPGGIATGEVVGAAAVSPGQVSVLPTSIAESYALRFYGHGSGDIDRVWIPLESGGVRTPVDVGGDFTYEFWIKCRYADNDALVSDGDTRYRNAILDRDIWNDARGWTFAVARSGSNLVCGFAIAGSGLTWTTITGTANVGDDQWHHIALVRRGSDGLIHIYVDGTLDASGTLYSANLQHTIGQDNSPITGADYQLVIAAEKHDAGSAYPSYNGHFDELRISNTRRYTTGFTPPSRPLGNDANTVGLYHCDQGSGTTLTDSATVSGAPTNGTLLVGGSAPAGPVWVGETATIGTPTVTRTLGLIVSGLASAEAFGSHTLAPGSVTLLAVSITTDEVLGTAQLAPGLVSLLPGGITTGEAFGGTTLALFLAPGGIATGEALGTALLSLFLTPGDVASAEALGSLRLDLGLALSGIAGGEAFGAAVLTTGSVTISPSGLATGEAFGEAVVTAGGALIQVSAIAGSEAFGSAVLSPGPVTLVISNIGSQEAFGGPTVTTGAFLIQVSGIATGEAFGTLTLIPGGVTLQPGSIAGGETFGSAQLAPGPVTLVLSGIGSSEVVGSVIVTQGGVIVVPVAIATDEAFGSGQVTSGPVTVQPVAIGSQEAIGAALLIPDAMVIGPSEIGTGEALGAPALLMVIPPGPAGSGELFGQTVVTLTRILFGYGSKTKGPQGAGSVRSPAASSVESR